MWYYIWRIINNMTPQFNIGLYICNILQSIYTVISDKHILQNINNIQYHILPSNFRKIKI